MTSRTEKNVFQKLGDASTNGTGATLSFADVDLLMDLVGDALGQAENEFDAWIERLEDYERNWKRESGSDD